MLHLLLFLKLPLLLIVTAFLSASYGASNATFLILGNSSVAPLLDKFEQPVNKNGANGLLPHTPLRVVTAHELLGDQITAAIRVTYNKNIYFLVINDNGTQKSLHTFEHCTVLEDTVIVAATSVPLFRTYPPQSPASRGCKKGTAVARFFSTKGATYLRPLTGDGNFYWTTATSSNFQVPAALVPVKQHYNFTEYQQRIQKRLTQANTQYDSLFGFFNRITQQQKTVPHWEFSSQPNRYIFTLQGSMETTKRLAQSTRYLVNDIENILLGKPFSVTCTDNRIEIMHHTNNTPF